MLSDHHAGLFPNRKPICTCKGKESTGDWSLIRYSTFCLDYSDVKSIVFCDRNVDPYLNFRERLSQILIYSIFNSIGFLLDILKTRKILATPWHNLAGDA